MPTVIVQKMRLWSWQTSRSRLRSNSWRSPCGGSAASVCVGRVSVRLLPFVLVSFSSRAPLSQFRWQVRCTVIGLRCRSHGRPSTVL